MPERTTRTQLVQVAPEGTAGSPSTATDFVRMVAMSIEPSIQAEIDVFKPIGHKYPTLTALNREWAEADITGEPTYTELIYPLASVVKSVAAVAATASSSYNWIFTSSTSDPDTPETFRVQQGSSVRAGEFSYGTVTSFGMDISRDGLELNGQMLGQRYSDSITLSTSVSTLSLVPILPSQICVYLDTTAAGLGTTKLNRVINVNFSIGDRWGPGWFLDCDANSWVTIIETDPTVQVELTLEADSQGMQFLTHMRSNNRRFLRIEGTGGSIDNTFTYLFQADFSVEVSDPQEFSDEDGIYAIGWTLAAIHDATWGQAYRFKVRNGIAAL